MNATNDLRILIIDDNPTIHQDFIKILTTPQISNELDKLDLELFDEKEANSIVLPYFKIDTATQGKEGVDRIEQALNEGNPYALAFVDVRMPPGWDGIETIKHIWQIDPNIQIVICTAFSDYSWEETVENLGMTDNLLILKKPFDNVTVRQLACALVKKWQLMQELKHRAEFLEKTVEQRTQSLQESLSLIRSTIESSTDGILIVSNLGKIVDYNASFLSMWNIPESAIQTKEDAILLEYVLDQLQSPEMFMKATNDIYKTDEVSIDTLNFKDGRVFERYSQPHKLNGVSIGRVWSFRDITKRFYLEKKLEHQASHDALTDLPNRILLYDRIKHEISVSNRNKSKFGVLFLDIDRFKLINDSLGHNAGDQLLIEVANRLTTSLRASDTLARLGGDEFVLVISNINQDDHLFTIANKILELFKIPFMLGDRMLNISSSIGIALYPDDGDNPEVLLQNADLAMYRSKAQGMNQFQFYMKDLNEDSLKLLEIESEMRQALIKNEFFLTYQAQHDSFTGKVVATEALIRWNHPQRGVVLPMDFIPQAEISGLIVAIGEWVLKTACKQCKAWQDQGLGPVRIAINVASQQLKQSAFVETIQDALQESGLKPEYLEIEVTENIMLSSPDIVQIISKIRELGVKIALDDFGTGNSSLGYLRKASIDRLKIDKSFVSNIAANTNDEILIKSIIALAHSLNLDVVAEGVETVKQLNFLQHEECNDIQGYYFSKPLTTHDFEELLRANNVITQETINTK
ncbi:MAG: EAL domain-containing protein [Gammaproteobacteria bacterium]|jgi:diguanylate cyclase (GGDEF)-like protein|nr:EAL domain-containing protein [Gammaproteobacteria bacterium]